MLIYDNCYEEELKYKNDKVLVKNGSLVILEGHAG